MSEFNGLVFIATEDNEINYTPDQIQSVALGIVNSKVLPDNPGLGFFQFILKAGSGAFGINVSDKLQNAAGLGDNFYPLIPGRVEQAAQFQENFTDAFTPAILDYYNNTLSARMDEHTLSISTKLQEVDTALLNERTALAQNLQEIGTSLEQVSATKLAIEDISTSITLQETAVNHTASGAAALLEQAETKLAEATEVLGTAESILENVNLQVQALNLSQEESGDPLPAGLSELEVRALFEEMQTSGADVPVAPVEVAPLTEQDLETLKDMVLAEIRAEVP